VPLQACQAQEDLGHLLRMRRNASLSLGERVREKLPKLRLWLVWRGLCHRRARQPVEVRNGPWLLGAAQGGRHRARLTVLWTAVCVGAGARRLSLRSVRLCTSALPRPQWQDGRAAWPCHVHSECLHGSCVWLFVGSRSWRAGSLLSCLFFSPGGCWGCLTSNLGRCAPSPCPMVVPAQAREAQSSRPLSGPIKRRKGKAPHC